MYMYNPLYLAYGNCLESKICKARTVYILLQRHATILTNPNHTLNTKAKTKPQGTTTITMILNNEHKHLTWINDYKTSPPYMRPSHLMFFP